MKGPAKREEVTGDGGVNARIEWYDRKRPGPHDQPTLTIQATGSGTMNNAAAEALNWPDRIALGYDPETRIIAIRAADNDSTNAIKVRAQGNSSTREFSCMGFLNFYGIDYETSRRYPLRRAREGGILLADLKEGGADVSQKRSPQKKNREGG